jgi:hypothetical protein
VRIHNHKDHRVNLLADHIEFIKDRKYHIKPQEMAELIIEFLDDMYAKAYGQRVKDYLHESKMFLKKNNKI